MAAKVADGRANRMLRVDLTSRTAKPEPIPEDTGRRWIGAKGLGAFYLAKELEAGAEPLGPENRLIFATGPYQGTAVSSAGRMAVITKSPLTGIFIDSYVGGDIGHVVKRAGFDMLLFEGASDRPVWVDVTTDGGEVRDAKDLWGLTTHDTERRLKAEVGAESEVISIGPAGEKLVRFASPITRFRRAAGRGGTGAVFGSKRLKAVTVRGGAELLPAQPDDVKSDALGAINEIKQDRKNGDSFLKYGTSQSPTHAAKNDRLPTRNYSTADFERAGEIVGEEFHHQFDMTIAACCAPCTIACEGRVRKAERGTPMSERPEYETIALLGSNLGLADRVSIVESNEVCNAMGLDTISTGAAIGFAIECSKRGVIGEKFEWADASVPRTLIPKIAHREGIGDTLAEGVRRAAEIIGGDAWKWAVHGKGLELPAWDPRGKVGSGMAYATGDIGASHMRDEYTDKRTPLEPAAPVIPRLVEGQDRLAIRDSLILCAFATDWTGDERMVSLYNAITGEAATHGDLMERAHGIWTLTRAFNVREGIRRKDDNLSWRLTNDPLPSGRAKGAVAFLSDADRERSLDAYYDLRGWGSDGVPTGEAMRAAGVPFAL